MTIQEITVEKEIAVELKENGFPQDSLFCFHSIDSTDNSWQWFLNKFDDIIKREHDYISAPTAEELLKELPESIHDNNYIKFLTITKENYYIIEYSNISKIDRKLCNALAKCWLYLKKNNLLEV